MPDMTNSATTPKSRAALKAALEAIGPCHERTAALLLFFAVARHLGEVYDRETAGELAYMAADDLATGKRP